MGAKKRLRDESAADDNVDLSSLSKRLPFKLSFWLRHGARKGLEIDEHGWVAVDALLSRNEFRGITVGMIRDVVTNCALCRFQLLEAQAGMEAKIRATQGHSSAQVSDEMHQQILDAASIGQGTVVHGTSVAVWLKIRHACLKVRRINHIHFSLGMPGQGLDISGMRGSATVAVHIDLVKAMSAGIEFVRSPNGVVLTTGDEQGIVHPRFFSHAIWLGPPVTILYAHGKDQTPDWLETS